MPPTRALLSLAAVALHAQSPSTVPALIGDGWDREDPAKVGFDPARLQTVLEGLTASGANVHAVIVERHGKLVAEVYRSGKDKGVYSLFARTRDFGPTSVHDTRSVGKSVVSLLLGVARGQGKLKDLSASAVGFYPEFGDLATPERKAITLAHFLTMSSGLQWQEGGPGRDDEHHLYWAWNPCRYVFERPVATVPGVRFTYNSGGSAVLADVLQRATGVPLRDYARRELFEPLGITDWEWVGDLHGRPMAFTGLRMRPRDMAKLGRLVADRGRWKGRQLVPADWIDASLTPRMDTGFDGLRYGYQWWCGTADWKGRALPWAAAFGNGGQRIFVVRELDLVVVVTAGAYGDLGFARRVNAFLGEVVSAVRE